MVASRGPRSDRDCPAGADLIAASRAFERAGEIGLALSRAREALAVARDGDDPGAIATALAWTAKIEFRLGHYPASRALADEALSLASADSAARIDAWLVLGNCASETNSPADAERYYDLALDLGRATGRHEARVRALHFLSAGVYMERGQFALSLAADAEALRLARERGLADLLWWPLLTMSWVRWMIADYAGSRAAAAELRATVTSGSLGEGWLHYVEAVLEQDDGDPGRAAGLLARARAIAEAVGDPGLNVVVRLAVSRGERLAGSPGAARDWATDALNIATQVGYEHLRGWSLIERGRALWSLGDLVAAEGDLRAATEILAAVDASYDLARARLFLAALLWRERRADAPAAWADAAAHLLRDGYAHLVDQDRMLFLPLIAGQIAGADAGHASLATALLEQVGRTPPALHLRLLGGLAIRQGSRDVDPRALRRRRAGDLFCLLALDPDRSLSYDQVIDALWPDRPPDAALVLLHHATSTLRLALEPELPDRFPSRYLRVADGQVSLFLPPGSSVDVEAFERDVRDGRWADAVAAYGAGLLPRDLYADWTAATRERLAEGYVRALLGLAQRQLELGQPALALDSCQRALDREPWNEQAALLGLAACRALADPIGAARLYRAFVAALSDELGLEPSARLRWAYSAAIETAAGSD